MDNCQELTDVIRPSLKGTQLEDLPAGLRLDTAVFDRTRRT